MHKSKPTPARCFLSPLQPADILPNLSTFGYCAEKSVLVFCNSLSWEKYLNVWLKTTAIKTDYCCYFNQKKRKTIIKELQRSITVSVCFSIKSKSRIICGSFCFVEITAPEHDPWRTIMSRNTTVIYNLSNRGSLKRGHLISMYKLAVKSLWSTGPRLSLWLFLVRL